MCSRTRRLSRECSGPRVPALPGRGAGSTEPPSPCAGPSQTLPRALSVFHVCQQTPGLSGAPSTREFSAIRASQHPAPVMPDLPRSSGWQDAEFWPCSSSLIKSWPCQGLQQNQFSLKTRVLFWGKKCSLRNYNFKSILLPCQLGS